MSAKVTSVGPKNAVTVHVGGTASIGYGGWMYDQSGITYEQAGLLYDGGPVGASAVTSVGPKNAETVRV